ncbi:MAG TPA: hypothetical protein VFQ53_39845 [Kofleriaceae bacterium]|nr:hypothetical protein [Kofleriaceae bacterium]
MARHAPYTVAPELERELVAHYSEPHRAYHNTTHIAELLQWFDVVADEVGWTNARDVYDAILFHDVIYDPRAAHGDNERMSAALARRHGASEHAAELILLTARHGSIVREAVDADAAHFLDSDTAILGAEPAAFDAYDAAIAREYAHVPPDAFEAGRGAFLAKMLAQPRIFLSDFFHARLDARARDNLGRALARYQGQDGATSS